MNTRTLAQKMMNVLTPVNDDPPGPNGELPLGYRPIILALTNDSRSDPVAAHVAHIMRSGDSDIYKEVAVEIRNKRGELDACVIIGLDSKTLEPVIHITTDGLGDGDHNISIRPMRAAEDSVKVDLHNAQVARQSMHR